MGERGNIVFHYAEGKRVYLYTHWRGNLLHEILREAMNHHEEARVYRGGVIEGERCLWTDASYFARVVFCRLVAGDERGVLSFGIGVERTLPDYDELHVDVDKKEVRQVRLDPIEGATGRWEGIAETVVARWTFEDFAANLHRIEAGSVDTGELGVDR